MRFLIIGASGFIGSHILTYVRAMGYEAIGTQAQSNHPGLITFDLLEHRIEDCVTTDIFDTDQQVVVIICAALSQIDRCLLEKEVSYKINVEHTIRLIQDLKKLDATPVFISTCAVYDGYLGYYNEDSPHNPICEYGRHKDAIEQYLQKEAPNTFVLRLDKIVTDDPDGNHMFLDWFQQLEKQQPIICIDQTFSTTFVKDVAKAILLGCQLKLSGAYNVSNTEFFTRVELAKQFAYLAGKEVEIILKPQEEFNFADPRQVRSYMDSSRFRQESGINFTPMRNVINSFLFYVRQADK